MQKLNYLELSLIECALEQFVKDRPLAKTETCQRLLEKIYKMKINSRS